MIIFELWGFNFRKLYFLPMSNLINYLKEYFGYDNFRDGQQEIITSIINCNDTLVVMATGGGKSLCYQIPAIVLPGTTIVVSPLIALMKDQVDTLTQKGIPATLINSTIDYTELTSRMQNAINGEYKLIYVAPERLESKSFIKLLSKVRISFVAIDEAHCISEWGHDFRPSYISINKIFDNIERVPIIALTATATPEVQNDIINILKLKNVNKYIKGFDRKNLNFRTTTSIDKIIPTIELLNDTKSGSTIIYAGSRKRVDYFTEELRKYKINAEAYHAGLKQQIRDSVQNRFIKDKTKVIVATNAFGMGIDKSDVRNVIHLDITSTLEQYYQEAGRAGRDGKESTALLIYHHSDLNLQNFFIKNSYPGKNLILKIYNYIIKNTTNAVVPNTITIANEIGVSHNTIDNIFRLLERDEVIQKENFSRNAGIRILATPERINEYFNNLSLDKQKILEELLRITPREAFHRTVDIDVKQLLYNNNFKKEDIYVALRTYNFSGIFEITNYNEANNTNYIHNNTKEITINFEDLDRREKYAYQKLTQVVEYAETTKCKRNYILNYFGEFNDNSNCEKCSSCNTQDIKTIKLKQRTEYLENIILKLVDELKNLYTEKEITAILTGSKTAFELSNTDEIKLYYGAANDYNKQETEEIISKLIIKQLIHKSNSKKIAITPLGKSKLKYN